MSVYKRPLRSDELMHASKFATAVKKQVDGFAKLREQNLRANKYSAYYSPKAVSARTSEFDRLNSKIAEIKSIIANPSSREKGYVEDYKRELESLYEKKQKLKDKWSRIKAEADASK